jgi:hypothetical protein
MTTPSALPPATLWATFNCISQEFRQIRLEALYVKDGRNDPRHPMHGLYTGLALMSWWRRGCTATPMPIGPLQSMLRRHKLHLAAGDYNSARREYEALSVFRREGKV